MALGDGLRERRRTAELAAWQARRDRVASLLERARGFVGATNEEVPTLPLELLEGEHALLVLPGVELIEPRHLAAHFMGGTGGFAFAVGAGGGGPGEGDPAAIDAGVVTVTDRRAVFAGRLHTRTWEYADVIGLHSNARPPWTAIAVSDRQKVSGIRYDPVHAEEFRFSLVLGLARCHSSEASLVDDLERQLDDIDGERPRPTTSSETTTPSTISSTVAVPVTAPSAVPPGSPLPPAGWYPDPYRVARLRWWDGRVWTADASP